MTWDCCFIRAEVCVWFDEAKLDHKTDVRQCGSGVLMIRLQWDNSCRLIQGWRCLTDISLLTPAWCVGTFEASATYGMEPGVFTRGKSEVGDV